MAEEGDSLLSAELTEKKEVNYETPCCFCLSPPTQTSLFATLVIACSPNALPVAFLAKAGTELGTSQTAIGFTYAIQLLGCVLGIGISMLLPVERTFMWLTKIALPVSAAAMFTLGLLGQYFINTKQANLFLVTVFVCRLFIGISNGLIEAIAQVMAMRGVDKESMTSAVGRTELGRVAAYSIGPIMGGTLYQYGGFYLPCCFSGALFIGMCVWGCALVQPYVHRDYATTTTTLGSAAKMEAAAAAGAGAGAGAAASYGCCKSNNGCTTLLKIPAIVAVYASSLLGVAQTGYFEATLQLYLAEAPYSLSPMLFGVLNGTMFLVAGALTLLIFVPLLEQWLGAPTTIVTGFLLISLGATIMGLPTLSLHTISRHLPLFVVGYGLFGIGMAQAIIVAPSLTKRILEAHGHTSTSPALVSATGTLYVFANTIGWGIGALVGSIITEAKGFEVTALVSAMVCIIVAPVLTLFLLPCAVGDLRNKEKQEKD